MVGTAICERVGLASDSARLRAVWATMMGAERQCPRLVISVASSRQARTGALLSPLDLAILGRQLHADLWHGNATAITGRLLSIGSQRRTRIPKPLREFRMLGRRGSAP